MAANHDKALPTEEQRRKEIERNAQLSRFSTAASLLVLCYLLFLCLVKKADTYSTTVVRNVTPVKSIGKFSWGCPPDASKDSLHDELWCENLDLINASFESGFIQGILDDTLSQEAFDDSELEEAYFSLSIAENVWEKVCKNKECKHNLKKLMERLDKAYDAFGSDVFTTYGFVLADLEPNAATQAYMDFVKGVMNDHPAEYSAVVAAADIRIHVELAERLKKKGVMYLESPHEHWVHLTLEMKPLLRAVTRFIDGGRDVLDFDTAKGIYREALEKNLATLKVGSMAAV